MFGEIRVEVSAEEQKAVSINALHVALDGLNRQVSWNPSGDACDL
ncbi:hypothetical protein [Paraburkholderia sp. D1E]